MPPAPNRRWFRFRLRTVFVVVAALAAGLCWVARQRNIVEERRRAIQEIGPIEFTNPPDITFVLFGCVEDNWMAEVRGDIPWIWRLLGAQAVFKIVLDSADYTAADAEHFAAIFPESCHVELNSSGTNVMNVVPRRWQ